MSLLSTKPRWFSDAIPSNLGWINPKTNEVLVSIGNLKSKLEAEQLIIKKDIPMEPVQVEQVSVVNQESEVKQKRQYNKKPKLIGEVVESKQQIIGEVTEYNNIDLVSE